MHWYDERTGTEHLWGVGHLAVKVSETDGYGVRAVVRQSTVLGAGAGVHESGGWAALGAHRDRRMRIGDDTSVWIGWAGSSPFRARVGAVPPWWERPPDPAETERGP